MPETARGPLVAEAAWRLLRQQLTWLDGQWIGFLSTPDPGVAGTLAQRAEWQLRGRARVLRRFRPDEPAELASLLPALEEAAGSTHGCLWVEAVRGARGDSGEPDDWLAGWSGLLQALNHRRDSLRLALADAGLLLVGPPAMVDAARRLAPDLWSARSLHLDVAGEPRPVDAPAERHRIEMPAGSGASDVLPADMRSGAAAEVLGAIRAAERARSFGEVERAAELAREALEVAERAAPPLVGYAAVQLALSLRALGDLGGGLAAAHEAVRASLPDDRQREVALDMVGELAVAVGDWAGAEAAYAESLAIARALAEALDTPEARRDLSVSLDNLGRVRQAAAGSAAQDAT